MKMHMIYWQIIMNFFNSCSRGGWLTHCRLGDVHKVFKISCWIKMFLPTWQPCEYVVTTMCTESAAETILLRIYQVQLTLLCIVFQRIHNYKWLTFTIGNLILQKWHKINKIVGGIEMNSAIPFQFRSILSCNSNSTACNSNSNSGIGIGIAINFNSNSGIDPNPA